MTIKELKIETDKMIEDFIDCLGLDGKYYVSCMDCPIAFGKTAGIGEFLTAKSNKLEKFLDNSNYNDTEKEYINDEGLIVISDELKNKKLDKDLIITILHETFHANRMLLVNTQSLTYDGEVGSVLYYKDHNVLTNDSNEEAYFDASQEIFHGSVDNSLKSIEELKKINQEELEDMSFADEKTAAKMTTQQNIDEALVELMAYLVYGLKKHKSKDIMEEVRKINSLPEDDIDNDIKGITNIILRHGDLELFKWMIDPLSYQLDDINYDFFANYLNEEDLDDIALIDDQDADLYLSEIIDKNISKTC